MLGGFSQGSMMSYALGLGAGRPRPAGILALSGFFPEVEGLEVDLTPPLPPIAIGHGVYDPIIGVEWGRRARERLEEAGADVLYREYPLPHAVDPGFLVELRPWLRSAVSDSDAPLAGSLRLGMRASPSGGSTERPRDACAASSAPCPCACAP